MQESYSISAQTLGTAIITIEYPEREKKETTGRENGRNCIQTHWAKCYDMNVM